MIIGTYRLVLLLLIGSVFLTTSIAKTSAHTEEIPAIKVIDPLVGSSEIKAVANSANTVEPDDPSVRSKLPKKLDGRVTFALALGGGGVHGAAHVGVLKVLEKAHIKVDCIVGSSMGAVIGGFYSAGMSVEEIEHLITDKSLRRAYLPSSLVLRVLSLPLRKVFNPFSSTYAGIWTGNKFQKFLETSIPADKQSFDQLDRLFYAIAVNLLDGKAYSIHTGSLPSAIHASAALAPILSPTMVDGKLFIDGGVRANLPAYAARQTGAGIVCAINVDTPLKEMAAKRFRKFRRIGSRITDIMLAQNDEHQLLFADIVINPDVSNIRVLSKKVSDVERAEKAGELAAERALPDIIKMIGSRSTN